MDGLYALKPWYAARLAGVRRWLIARHVSPNAISIAGLGFAAAAAGVIWLAPVSPLTAIAVGTLLAGRLACANLDGGIAREAGRATPRGALLNELVDRAGELLVIAAFAPYAPLWLLGLVGLAATVPSWVSLAGAAAGAPRLQGGPMGKTERCLLITLAAGAGFVVPILGVVAAGSVVTACVRLPRLWHTLGSPR